MMEFVDNKWLMKVVELCIDRVSDIFGPATDFSSVNIIGELRKQAKEYDRLKKEEEKEETEEGERRAHSAILSTSYVSPHAGSREKFFAAMSAEPSPSPGRQQPS